MAGWGVVQCGVKRCCVPHSKRVPVYPSVYPAINDSRTDAGATRVVCATVAFGMGMDFPNITLILHWDAALSLQDFVQQTGRGGRNGNHCLCITFYEPKFMQLALRRARRQPDARRRAQEEESVEEVSTV